MYDRHLRLSARGLFVRPGAGGAPVGEEWSFRLNLSAPLGGPPVEDLIDDMTADLAAFHARAGTGINPRAVLREVKLALIGPLGLYDGNPAVRFVDVAGGRAVATYPPQVALAVSLDTGVRGPSRRGRIYLPAPTFALDDNFLISAIDALGCAESTALLITNLNNAPGADPVGSPKVTIASTKGFNTDVTSVRCGRVLDTMRSRRTSLPELYSADQAV
jgi:hypothetical protein